MNDDDKLISKLLTETCIEAPDKDQPNAVLDLRNYFERKLNEVDFISINDYLIQHSLDMSKLTFQNMSQCYRLVFKGSVLDFPSNWSIFKDIKSDDMVYVDQSLDQDFLLDIFSELKGNFTNIALVKDSNEVTLIYLPEEASKDHIQWFRGYFEKKNSQESKEAA